MPKLKFGVQKLLNQWVNVNKEHVRYPQDDSVNSTNSKHQKEKSNEFRRNHQTVQCNHYNYQRHHSHNDIPTTKDYHANINDRVGKRNQRSTRNYPKDNNTYAKLHNSSNRKSNRGIYENPYDDGQNTIVTRSTADGTASVSSLSTRTIGASVSSNKTNIPLDSINWANYPQTKGSDAPPPSSTSVSADVRVNPMTTSNLAVHNDAEVTLVPDGAICFEPVLNVQKIAEGRIQPSPAISLASSTPPPDDDDVENEKAYTIGKDMLIPKESVVFFKSVKKGNFGFTYHGKFSNDPQGRETAIKVIRTRCPDSSLLLELKKVSKACSSFDCTSQQKVQNIADFYGLSYLSPPKQSNSVLGIISRYYKNSLSLDKFLRDIDEEHHILFQEKESQDLGSLKLDHLFFTIMKGIVNGLSTLHSHDIVHANLKPENILISIEPSMKNQRTMYSSDDITVRITDAGVYSIFLTDENFYRQSFSDITNGTLPHWFTRYTAPDIIQQIVCFGEENHVPKASVSPEVDIYSFAMIMICILTRQEPFSHLNDLTDVIGNLLSEHNQKIQLTSLLQDVRMFPKKTSSKENELIADFLGVCLNYDPAMRNSSVNLRDIIIPKLESDLLALSGEGMIPDVNEYLSISTPVIFSPSILSSISSVDLKDIEASYQKLSELSFQDKMTARAPCVEDTKNCITSKSKRYVEMNEKDLTKSQRKGLLRRKRIKLPSTSSFIKPRKNQSPKTTEAFPVSSAPPSCVVPHAPILSSGLMTDKTNVDLTIPPPNLSSKEALRSSSSKRNSNGNPSSMKVVHNLTGFPLIQPELLNPFIQSSIENNAEMISRTSKHGEVQSPASSTLLTPTVVHAKSSNNIDVIEKCRVPIHHYNHAVQINPSLSQKKRDVGSERIQKQSHIKNNPTYVPPSNSYSIFRQKSPVINRDNNRSNNVVKEADTVEPAFQNDLGDVLEVLTSRLPMGK